MSAIDSIRKKRSILLTTRMRFSPHIQPVRESALEKMIEQILFSFESPHSLNLQEIETLLSSETGGYAIGRQDMVDALQRSINKDRVITEPKGNLTYYKLSDSGRMELADTFRGAEIRFKSVVNRLFRNAKEGPAAYGDPFLQFLCSIFSKLSEESVRVIRGQIRPDDFLTFPFLSAELERINQEHKSINHSDFRKGVFSFFQDVDPEYDLIKWNIAQSYYIVKALGIDPSGILFSKEVFGDGIFYLDTNIIISALEPKDRYHDAFLALNKACKELGITFRVCRITLMELERLLQTQYEVFEKVVGQIPEQTASKIRSVFCEIYLEKKRAGETPELPEVFASFDSPHEKLQTLFGVEVEDDPWFDEASIKAGTMKFAEALKVKYSGPRKRKKTALAALHDAQLLLWVEGRRTQEQENIWVMTSDTSLPGSNPRDDLHESFAITSDAFLQWMSPIAASQTEDDGFSSIFADMIRNRVVPQERMFDLRDFTIFADMHMSCKELPAEDVEDCIRYIKANVPTLDPGVASDREKLAYEVSKFFADPGRTYKREISRLENERIGIVGEYESKLADSEEQISRIREEVREKDNKIEEIGRKFVEFEERNRSDKLRRSAWLRLAITLCIFVALETSVVALSVVYGVGENTFQKVSVSWHLLVGVVPVTLMIAWFMIGRERLKMLGWPFTKIFGSES